MFFILLKKIKLVLIFIAVLVRELLQTIDHAYEHFESKTKNINYIRLRGTLLKMKMSFRNGRRNYKREGEEKSVRGNKEEKDLRGTNYLKSRLFRITPRT